MLDWGGTEQCQKLFVQVWIVNIFQIGIPALASRLSLRIATITQKMRAISISIYVKTMNRTKVSNSCKRKLKIFLRVENELNFLS